jgi:hypothetical protein
VSPPTPLIFFCPYSCSVVAGGPTHWTGFVSTSFPARNWLRGIAGAAIAVLACTLLSGCSAFSHVVADNWPRMLGGLPEGVPPRDQNPAPALPVHDMPPPRDSERMTAEERKRSEEELKTIRSQTTTQGEETRRDAPGR